MVRHGSRLRRLPVGDVVVNGGGSEGGSEVADMLGRGGAGVAKVEAGVETGDLAPDD